MEKSELFAKTKEATKKWYALEQKISPRLERSEDDPEKIAATEAWHEWLGLADLISEMGLDNEYFKYVDEYVDGEEDT